MGSPGFKIADAYTFAAVKGLQLEADQIRSMLVHPTIRKPHVVRKGCFVDLFESHGVIDDFIAQYWPGRRTSSGERRRATYLDQKTLNERLISGEPPDEDALEGTLAKPDEDMPSEAERASFALEAQLRDFIAQNLARIPINGKRLILYTDSSGRNGVEYPTDVGPIDILAVDEAGNFFVFELKLDRGPDRALGQLARYMGWVKLKLAQECNVGGVVVAKSIDEKLRYAVCVIPNVTLLEYDVEFRLRDITSITV